MAGLVDGKVALVTGGGSGMGRASALAFSREGAKVVVVDVVDPGGEETVRMIHDRGGEAIFVHADVSKAADAEAAVNRAVQTYGRLDIAHNQAGIEGAMARLADYPEEMWDRVLSINLKGIWLFMKYEIPQMLKQGGGAIVNTASIEGLIGTPGGAAYVAAKHGVVGITKVAALDYAKDHIRVNAICPGFIHTPMIDRLAASSPDVVNMATAATPVGRMGEPDEIVQAAVWLCSDRASYTTGGAYPVDGGFVAQ
jgi:NAD(P)-dependent dehydrogenase (short-subunit alcohol dehydrogenase family)